ncbi:hypothetical protein ACFWY5_28160 [Nonomuraea sp. NPDC059007]|uniref:hypothetical protein n=1 Tax=Nonomuraea sp. NPDC059007 TaxID=3346692 RepID=UPI0036BDDE8F
MKSERRNRPYLLALFIFLLVVLGILFLPRLVYGAILESQVEKNSEEVLEKYAEQVSRRLMADPQGNSWRDVKGARVLGHKRQGQDSLIISTVVTVPAGAVIFSSNGYEVRCYDIVFTHLGRAGQRFELDKVPGCEEELLGPARLRPS